MYRITESRKRPVARDTRQARSWGAARTESLSLDPSRPKVVRLGFHKTTKDCLVQEVRQRGSGTGVQPGSYPRFGLSQRSISATDRTLRRA